MSCWQKMFIVFVARVLLRVLLAALMATANANSRSVVRHAYVSSRAEMYVSLSVPTEPVALVGGLAYAALSYSFAMACN
jgi:hypothetical protein